MRSGTPGCRRTGNRTELRPDPSNNLSGLAGIKAVTALQASGLMWGVVTWASARRTRFAQAFKLRAFSPNSSCPTICSNFWAKARENIPALRGNVMSLIRPNGECFKFSFFKPPWASILSGGGLSVDGATETEKAFGGNDLREVHFLIEL